MVTRRGVNVEPDDTVTADQVPRPLERPVLALVVAVIAAIVSMFLAPLHASAAAADEDTDTGRPTTGEPVVVVNSVDATDTPIRVGGWLVGGSPGDVQVSLDGDTVTPASANLNSTNGRQSDVMVVVDNAASLRNGTVQLSKSSLAPLMPGAGAADSLGVVSSGGVVKVVQGLTSDPGTVTSSLRGVIPDGLSQTWTGVRQAARLLADRGPNADRAVVLIAGAPILSTDGGYGSAVAALREAGVEFHVIALPNGVDTAALSAAVADVGGTFRAVDSDEGLTAATQRVAELLAGRFTLTLDPAETPVAEGGLVQMTVTMGDSTSTVAYVPDALRTGSTALAPLDATGSGGGFFASAVFKWLAVLLVIAAVVVLFWAVITVVLPDEHNLVKRLEVYEDPYGETTDEYEDSIDDHATVPILRRAVELTGDLADKRGLTENLEFKLEQANIPLRAAEGMFFAVAASIVILILVLVVTGNVLFGIAGAAVCIMVPKAMLEIAVRRRQKAFVAQLPDMLALLAGTLRAGYSISQGFESVSTEIDEPMGRELRRVVSEARLGRPLEEALESVAERMDSEDFSWAVMAIRIQREVGGNLAELLMTVAETMTERERLRRDVATLTAEGKMSAIVIGILPPALSMVMFVMNPDYIKQLFNPGLGYMLVGMAIISMGIGFAWMRKTVAIEV